MSESLISEVHLAYPSDYDENLTEQWSFLFQKSFGVSRETSLRVFEKYKLNDSRICYLTHNGVMVASYCGLKLNCDSLSVFISTDTMSDGTISGASVRLARIMYRALASEGVVVVVGYPNENIRKLREKALGWTLVGGLNLYVGIPLLWPFKRNLIPPDYLWKIKRPPGGFFVIYPFLVKLLCRDCLYGTKLGLLITLSSKKPGMFFLKIPNVIFKKRRFGYLFLCEDVNIHSKFLKKIQYLDVDTADIP